MRKIVKVLVALAAVVVVSVTLAHVFKPQGKPTSGPVASAAPVGAVGFSDSFLWFLSPEDINRQLDLYAATNVHSARILMPWAGIQPGPDQYDWGQADTIVNAANARGISVIALLNSTPQWATSGSAIASPPDSMDTFGNFAGTMASHFAGRVAGYEIWNEENAVQFWKAGPKGPEPERYAEMLKASYPRIKSADPAATVIVGGLSPTINFFSITKSPVEFLNRMYAAGAGGSFDALAFHPYLFTSNAAARFSTGKAGSPIGLYNQLRATMNSNGDGGKQIWATEFGEATSKVDDATQAAWIGDFIPAWRGLPGSGPLFIYTTRDRNTGSSNPQDTYGVYRTDFSPKPAAGVIKSLA